MEEALQVLRGSAAPKSFEQLPNVGGYRDPFAGQQLVQGHIVVWTDATAGNQGVRVQSGHMILVGDQRVPAGTGGAEHHFVVAEVGLLGDHGHAVGEGPLERVDRLDAFFPGNTSRGRKGCQQRDSGEGVHVGLHLQGVGRLELRLYRRGQFPNRASGRLFGSYDQQHRVPELRPECCQVIELHRRDLREQILVQLPLRLDAGHRCSAEKVLHVLLD